MGEHDPRTIIFSIMLLTNDGACTIMTTLSLRGIGNFMKKTAGDRRVVLRDIAELFDVAPITVSRALRRTGQVEAKLEAAIIQAAQKHGYSIEAQFHARALRQRRDGSQMSTQCICAIIRDAALMGESSFHLRIINGIERGAKEFGSELLMVTSSVAANRANVLPRVVIRRQVDGVVWLLSEIDLLHLTEPCPVPLVCLLFPLPGADVVAVDDHGAMRVMGEHLAKLGHRHVAFVGPDSELAQARLAGLRAGLVGTGGSVCEHDVRMKPYAMLPETVLPLVREIMERRRSLPAVKRVTTIAVYNDYMATTVIRCLQDDYGLRVPQDMSVTGFDGLDRNSGATLKLTTVAIPLEELGAEAVRLISWRMQNPQKPLRRVDFPVPLVTGETAGRLG